MKKDLEEKLEASINNIEIEKFAVLEMLKIAEKYVNEKDYTLEKHLTMIGFAVETNKYIEMIKDEKIKNELEEKADMLWNKWYEKSQEYLKRNSYLKMFKN